MYSCTVSKKEPENYRPLQPQRVPEYYNRFTAHALQQKNILKNSFSPNTFFS